MLTGSWQTHIYPKWHTIDKLIIKTKPLKWVFGDNIPLNLSLIIPKPFYCQLNSARDQDDNMNKNLSYKYSNNQNSVSIVCLLSQHKEQIHETKHKA